MHAEYMVKSLGDNEESYSKSAVDVSRFIFREGYECSADRVRS